MESDESRNIVIPRAVCAIVDQVTPDRCSGILEDLGEAYREFRLLCRDDAALGNLLRMTRNNPDIDFRELCLFIGVSHDGEPLEAESCDRYELLRRLDAVIRFFESCFALTPVVEIDCVDSPTKAETRIKGIENLLKRVLSEE